MAEAEQDTHERHEEHGRDDEHGRDGKHGRDDEHGRDGKHGGDDWHPQEPWWWGIGPLGAGVLVLVGVGWLLWLYVWSSGAEDDAGAGYGAGKAVCVGLVLLGGAVLERLRSRAARGPGAGEREED
ncbi:hypothetical protein [Streptomyces griseoaurantiacus]|uniref:hypothetical protein n=1 Tax=Streptomyces griseoaurantiacus TaxID=68213 RepID=UPI002E2C88C9|nr:hypothetical protein [Streptomyces jietaisiensis]